MDKKYKKRVADKLLAEQLEAAGVVLIQGPKWCGKTTTAQQAATSSLFLDNPATMNLLAVSRLERFLRQEKRLA